MLPEAETRKNLSAEIDLVTLILGRTRWVRFAKSLFPGYRVRNLGSILLFL
jgi:hypothetical protein